MGRPRDIADSASVINALDGVTATGTEINTLDGITSTTAELNILDGVTSTASELNILDGVTSTAAEINILDGVTSTASELNILDGVTSTATELNILDGVTSSAAELNILDGVTSTAAELNILDGVTANATEINKLDALSRGSILYGDSSGATAILTKGSADQVLKSDGTDIAWGSAAAGGTNGLHLLSTVTASNSSTVDLETTFDSTYEDYIIKVSNYRPSIDSTHLKLRVKDTGSASYRTNGYQGLAMQKDSNSSGAPSADNSYTDSIKIGNSVGGDSYEAGRWTVEISKVSVSGIVKLIYSYGAYVNSNGKAAGGYSFGFCGASTNPITGIQFLSSDSGNIAAGTFRLYGVAKT